MADSDLKSNADLSGFAGVSDADISKMTHMEAFVRMFKPNATDPKKSNDFVFITETNHKNPSNAFLQMQALLAMRAANPEKKLAFFYELPPETDTDKSLIKGSDYLEGNLVRFCKDMNIQFFRVDAKNERDLLDDIDDKRERLQASLARLRDVASPNDAQSKKIAEIEAELKTLDKGPKALHAARNDHMVTRIRELTHEHSIEKALVMNGDWHLKNPEDNPNPKDMDEQLQAALPDHKIAYIRLNEAATERVSLKNIAQKDSKDSPDIEMGTDAKSLDSAAQKLLELNKIQTPTLYTKGYTALDKKSEADFASGTTGYQYITDTPLWNAKSDLLNLSQFLDGGYLSGSGFYLYPSNNLRARTNDMIARLTEIAEQEPDVAFRTTVRKTSKFLEDSKKAHSEQAKADLDILTKLFPNNSLPTQVSTFLNNTISYQDKMPQQEEKKAEPAVERQIPPTSLPRTPTPSSPAVSPPVMATSVGALPAVAKLAPTTALSGLSNAQLPPVPAPAEAKPEAKPAVSKDAARPAPKAAAADVDPTSKGAQSSTPEQKPAPAKDAKKPEKEIPGMRLVEGESGRPLGGNGFGVIAGIAALVIGLMSGMNPLMVGLLSLITGGMANYFEGGAVHNMFHTPKIKLSELDTNGDTIISIPEIAQKLNVNKDHMVDHKELSALSKEDQDKIFAYLLKNAPAQLAKDSDGNQIIQLNQGLPTAPALTPARSTP